MKVLIFGARGQIGSYLVDKLKKENVEISIYNGYLHNRSDIVTAISWRPDIIYNLAAQSSVATSFRNPVLTHESNTLAVLHMLEAIREFSPESKFIQASSAEIFGNNNDIAYDNVQFPFLEPSWMASARKIQSETTNYGPLNPYGVSKLAAHEYVKLYRESYGLHCKSVICFNAESSRRPDKFFTGKVRNYVRSLGGERLKVGDLQISRDFSHAYDIAEGYWLVGNYYKAEDFVLGSGESHTIMEFLEAAFSTKGLNWADHVETDNTLFRPNDVRYQCADNTKARTVLHWEPQYTFKTLIEEIING